MRLQDMIRAGIVRQIDDAGSGDEGLDAEAIAAQEAEIERRATEKAEALAEDKARTIADQRVAEERAKWEAEKAKPAETPTSPYDRAKAEFAAKGEEFDKDGIYRRATELIQEDTTRQIAEVKKDTHTRLLGTEAERMARDLVGEDKYAQEYAQKFIAGGADITKDHIKDVIVRGARDYSREKTPNKVDITVERSDTTGKPVPTSLRALANQFAIGDIKLTDEELREVEMEMA